MGCHSSKLINVEAELISYYQEACRLHGLNLPDSCRPKKSLLNNQNHLLFKHFLETSLSTARLLASVKLSLISQTRNRQQLILQALQCYDSFNNHSQTLSKLKDFKKYYSQPDRLAPLLATQLTSLCQRQRTLINDLHLKKREIKETMRSTNKCKKIWRVLHNAAFISLVVLSVALAAASAPPLATVAVAAGCTVMKTAEQWFDLIWAERMGSLDGEKDIVLAIMKGGLCAEELGSVRAMAKRLEIKVRSIEADTEFAIDREDEEIAVDTAMEEIRGKLGGIEELITGMEMKVEACEAEIRKANAQVLELCYE